MPKSRELKFIVRVKQPEGATVGDVQRYILDAVASWGGSLRPPGGYGDNDPGDPCFDIGKSVGVTRVVERK